MKSPNFTWVRHFVWGLLAVALSGWPILLVILVEPEEGQHVQYRSLVAVCAILFANGWLLSLFGKTNAARTVALAAFPFHTWLMVFSPAAITMNLRWVPQWMALVVYGLSVAACVAIACGAVLSVQRAFARPKPSPPSVEQP